jgi:hypothetical protein
MPDQEERNGQLSEEKLFAGKLVLPALSEAVPGEEPADPQQRTVYISPAQLIRRPQTAPPGIRGKLSYFWNRDPAYRVFIIAVLLVVIASLIFTAVVGSALVQSGLGLQDARVPLTPPPGVAPTGTVDLRPTFPIPGGQGSNQSSLPNMPPTPALRPTQPANGQFAVQISGVPNSVPNDSDVVVTVTCDLPNAGVQLQVSYNVAPFFYITGGNTDANGVATLTWHVQVFSLSRRAQARVKAVVFGPDGQASSETLTVRIVGAGVAPGG